MDEELKLKLTIRLCTGSGERCFGPGVATLMERVREHHSLRAAAASMGMAYSKAWRIIRNAEEVFGCKLLDSTIGGKNGGGAVLTPQGERLLADYEGYCADVEGYSRGRFEDAFGFWLGKA